MMPLPWLMMFFMIFLSFYSVYLFISSFYMFSSFPSKSLKSSSSKLVW